MKKILIRLCLFLLALCMLQGCQNKEGTEEEGYKIYYVNKTETAVVSEPFDDQGMGQEELLKAFLQALTTIPENPDCKQALPETVKIQKYVIENKQLYLYFDGGYQELDHIYEVLCRAAVVRTLCQLPQVDYVSFFVNDQSLIDSNQLPVGLMNEESFVENTGEQINTFNSVTLNLYFANAAGDKLIKERDVFDYSSNMSLEKLVVEQLISGPVSDHAFPCIPAETKLLNITTKDGICYVNFDKGFLSQGYDVVEIIPIYAVVNSLVELQNVNKVQILVNGESLKTYREHTNLDDILERNFDIIEE